MEKPICLNEEIGGFGVNAFPGIQKRELPINDYLRIVLPNLNNQSLSFYQTGS